MALYKSPKIFTGQLSPVILPFGQPTGGGSLSSMGYHASKQSDPASEYMSDNSKFSDKLEGLPGANEAINSLYQSIDQQQAMLRSNINKVIFSDTATEDERQRAISDYHMGMNQLAAKRSELYIYAESAKDDKKYYEDDLKYATDNGKLDAPLLNFDYGSLAAGTNNANIAANGLFDNASAPLVYNDNDGRVMSVGKFMDFRRKLTATDKNGSPITYKPILRSQSDVDYTETLKKFLDGKNITTETLYDANGHAKSVNQLSSEFNGAGFTKRTVTTNLKNIQEQVNNMFEMLPAEALNRAAERLIASNISIPEGDLVVKEKVGDEEKKFEFSGSVSELTHAITYAKQKSQDPKLSDNERMFQRKVGVALANKFNNLVKAQVVMDASTAATGQITFTPSTTVYRNTESYNRLLQSESLATMVNPKVLRMRTEVANKKPGANARQTFFWGPKNIKEELLVHAGNFDSHIYPTQVMENMVGPLKNNKNEPIFHKLDEIGVPFMAFGGRGYSPNDIPIGLGDAVFEGVTTEYMVARKLEIDGNRASMSDNTDASYITAVYSIDKNDAKGIMLNSATVNSGMVKGQWKSDVIALNGKPYSLKKMIEVGNDPRSRSEAGIEEKDGRIYFEVKIPVYPEAIMDKETKASFYNTQKAQEIIGGYEAQSIAYDPDAESSEELVTQITPNSIQDIGKDTRLKFGFSIDNVPNSIRRLQEIRKSMSLNPTAGNSMRVAGTDEYLTDEELNSEY